MGKKIKKKTRSTYKEKRISSSMHSNSEHSNTMAEIRNEKASATKGKKECSHVDNSVDLDKITWNFSSPGNTKCEDCRDGTTVDRRSGKGKGKQARKKGVRSADGKSELKCLWVCLSCGHVACGGAAGDSTTQSHALRHSRQNRHPCAIQFDNPFLCWCFLCNAMIPVEKQEENGERNSILFHVQKLVKEQSMKGADMDIEDVWFGAGKVEVQTSEIGESSTSHVRGYRVRGLSNLGNTCFFNSVMQNLLAMDILRAYVMDLDQSVGPLTMAFRKLFTETNVDSDSKNGTNTKSLFGCICSKAPQFRAYQQQDSHELLRYLLDGLHTEELSTGKSLASTSGGCFACNTGPTFVDTIFGGQLSSTICCTECGNSSIVYEPFLDLSLPVPSKKSPPVKATISQPKKKKLSLKERNKGGKFKESKNANVVPTSDQTATRDVIVQSEFNESSSTLTSSAPNKDPFPLLANVDILSQADCIGPVAANDQTDAVVVDDSLSWVDYIGPDTANEPEASLGIDDAIAWLDYIEPNPALNGLSSVSAIQDSESGKGFQNENIVLYSSELSTDASALNTESQATLESYTENHSSDESPLHIQDSQVLLLPYKEEVLTMEETERTMPYCQNPGNTLYEDNSVKDLSGAALSINCWDDAEPDFSGFGDLFNEPEIVSNPKVELGLGDTSFQANDEAEVALLAGNSSESNQEEIDNTNAQVSIDSCLAFFTKPELLSDEHAWHCESCLKSLQRQRMEAGKEANQAVARDKELKTFTSQVNEKRGRNKNSPTVVDEGHAVSAASKASDDVKPDIDSTSVENSEHSCQNFGKLDIHTENSPQKQPNPFADESICTTHEFEQSENVMGLELLSNGVASHCKISEVVEDHGDMMCAPHELLHASVHDQTHCHVTPVDGSKRPCSTGKANLSGEDETQQEFSSASRDHELDDVDSDEINKENEKLKRNATKRYLISKAPPILTIHLKRFSQDARGRLSKLSGHVYFTDTLDLWPYMDPRCTEKEKCRYHLIGVVEHSGTMRSGHYIAYVRIGESRVKGTDKEISNPTWFYASDAYIREVSLTDVLQSEPYILFYEKI